MEGKERMELPNLVDIVKLDFTFDRYENKTLYYRTSYSIEDHSREKEGQSWYTSSCFEVPVPVDDSGDGTFEVRMKGITLMRWIRKHIEFMKTWTNDA